MQGLQAANANEVTISSHGGTLPVLQMLQSGQLVGSSIGFNADELTPEAEKSGAWYGSTDYRDGFSPCGPQLTL